MTHVIMHTRLLLFPHIDWGACIIHVRVYTANAPFSNTPSPHTHTMYICHRPLPTHFLTLTYVHQKERHTFIHTMWMHTSTPPHVHVPSKQNTSHQNKIHQPLRLLRCTAYSLDTTKYCQVNYMRYHAGRSAYVY